MDRKNQAVKVTKILHSRYEFKSIKYFPPGLLPITKHVICRVLNKDSYLK